MIFFIVNFYNYHWNWQRGIFDWYLFFTRQGGTGWGLGIVVNVVKKPTAGLGALPSKGGGYIVDTLLHCSPGPRVRWMWYVDASV